MKIKECPLCHQLFDEKCGKVVSGQVVCGTCGCPQIVGGISPK